VQRLRQAGVATVYSVCDFVDDAMVAATDRTAIVTAYLRSLHAAALQPKMDVVHDGIEHPQVQRQGPVSARARLHALMVTSHTVYSPPVLGAPPAPWQMQVLGQFAPPGWTRWRALWWHLQQVQARQRTAELRAALHPRLLHQPWSTAGVHQAMRSVDAGLIPIDTTEQRCPPTAPVPSWKLKSENRLTLLMAAGLPVVATPIPSYEDVIEHGRNGWFASSPRDWQAALFALRDPGLRQALGEQARASVLERFSVPRQAALMAQCVRQAVQQQPAAAAAGFSALSA
jgi:glycosyltransferase involved in cell wall biosynthesis